MAKKRRKFEIHKLTISGLADGMDYRSVICDSRSKIEKLKNTVWEHGGKSHALEQVHRTQQRLQMRFLSFRTGYRPDILDTENYEIEPNPLKETQTGVDYTAIAHD